MQIKYNYTKFLLTALRMAIGWHFMFEGMSKVFIDNWSAYSYLANTTGTFSGFYQWIASSDTILKIVDLLNIYGLLLIGAALFTGFFLRLAAFAGALLLTLYYFAYPPFGDSLLILGEGHLFIVDRNFIEGIALLFILFYKDKGYAFDTVIESFKRTKTGKLSAKPEVDTHSSSRRELLKNLASLPLLGIMGWGSFQSKRKYGVDVTSGATIQLNQTSLAELKGILPKGKIGDHEITRLILGGNLIINGLAHARDLIYVKSLVKAYNSEKKIYETLILAENAGINSIDVEFQALGIISRYKKATGSKITVISHVGPWKTAKLTYIDQINQSIDLGTDILQVAGFYCDWMVRDKRIDVIEEMVFKIRSQGLTVGLGAHTIDALVACEERGIIPDFYMITMHHDNYWSAHPRENRVLFEVDGEKYLDHNKYHDNIFCLYPEKTVEVVNRSKIPVIGFKVLAAGAIHPSDGFKWAFENGADFICVGMFDFQIVNDINICLDILGNLGNRKRKLYG